jgi:aspartyl-tRNA(Asn)/glutamyl-tRNA(Gln) amidotransferase subunit A
VTGRDSEFSDDEFTQTARASVAAWFGIDPPNPAALRNVAKLGRAARSLDALRSPDRFDDQPADFERALLEASRVPVRWDVPAVAWPATAVDGDLAGLSLTEAAEAVARAEVTSVELLAACLARIDALNPTVNATIWVDREAAFAAARRADRAVRDGAELGPLHGIPLAHKDMFYRAGSRTTCGAELRRDHRPAATATALELLDAAGAYQFAGLNMAEFARDTTGRNRTFGACHNPWSPEFITGGSSSGSAAAVASLMTYGSLGSDTGGSVRIPASACGVTSIKPTATRVSRYGAMPLSYAHDCVGPLARTARDCARILGVIAGHDERDPTSTRLAVAPYERLLTGELQGVRVGVVTESTESAETGIGAAVVDAVAVLTARGAVPAPLSLPLLAEIGLCGDLVSLVEPTAAHAPWLRDRPSAYEPDIAARMYAGYAVPAGAYLDALRWRGPLLTAFCREVFESVDVVVMPTLPLPLRPLAAAIAEDERPGSGRLSRWSENTRPFNYLGLPAASVPCGLDGNGCPIGMQIVGRPFDEALVLRVADAFQRDTDWHRRRPPLVERRRDLRRPCGPSSGGSSR